MSKLNSQNAADTAAILKRLVRSSDKSFNERELHELGLDIDVLEAVYDDSIKPYLDFLLGYKDLSELDVLSPGSRWSHRDASWQTVVEQLPKALDRQLAQTITVHISYGWYNVTQRRVDKLHFAVFMTRAGEWLLWSYLDICGVSENSEESIGHFTSLRELALRLNQLVDGWTENGRHYQTHFLYPPLDLASSLVEHVLQSTINQRQAFLDKFVVAQGVASKKINAVSPQSRH